ncbi:hypothetical protein JOQ06_007606, partial [Pogonophryne albipinna]
SFTLRQAKHNAHRISRSLSQPTELSGTRPSYTASTNKLTDSVSPRPQETRQGAVLYHTHVGLPCLT